MNQETAVSDHPELRDPTLTCMFDRLDLLLARSVVLAAEHRALLNEAEELLGAIAEASGQSAARPVQ